MTLSQTLLALAFVVALGLVGKMDADVQQVQVDHYCEMVKLGKEGRNGWPDYKGTYSRDCL